MLPRIENSQQAQEAVNYCHYMPLRQRGLNSIRLNRYVMDDLASFVQQAANETVVVAMIESLEGLEQLDEILKVEGIDIILEGAANLSQSVVRKPWQSSHPLIKEKVQEMYVKTKNSQKHFCAIPQQPEDIAAWKQHSVQLFVLGDDRSIIHRAHQNPLNAFKEI